MLRFTAVMPAGKLVTEISWALIRCDLGLVSRIFYTSFMLPENRMYFLQVFHNIIYFFLRAEVWVASRILILPYLFSHFSTFWPLRLTKVKCEYLKTHFRQFPPKEVQLFRFLDGNFDQKSSLQNSTLYTSELVFSVCSHPFFPVFVRGVWCDSTISDINLSDSVQDLVAEKPPRRGSYFFPPGKIWLIFCKMVHALKFHDGQGNFSSLTMPKVKSFRPQKESNVPSQLLFWKLCGYFQK